MGVIRMPSLFDLLEAHPSRVMALDPELIEQARRLHVGYTSATRRLHVSYTSATRQLHVSYTSAARQPHVSYTSAAPPSTRR